MYLTTLYFFLLVPACLAVVFLLWVLWNVTQQLSGQTNLNKKQPAISIQVSYRYTMRAWRTRADHRPLPVNNLNTEKNDVSISVERRPTLQSSSAAPGVRSSYKAALPQLAQIVRN